MRILFIHNNFPGQYRRVVRYLHQNNIDVDMYTATLEGNQQNYDLPRALYKPHREPTDKVHPSMVSSERAVLMGQAALKTLMGSEKKGFKPDIILSHSGWGASLFMKDLFPDAKLLNYYEWYYHATGSDSDFLMKDPYDYNGMMRIRMKNTPILHDLAAMDWGQSPTHFQHSQFPEIFRKNISVLHDGVDTDYFTPKEQATARVGDHVFTAEDEVITYVARGMEPYRGFPQFMEMVSRIQKVRPNLHVVVVGNDRVAYGSNRPDGKTYKEWALEEYDYDMDRLHFTGLQPLKVLRDLFRITRAHVYLTVPFVLSWSMLEAMSTGALIVGSDTDPVKELITDGENGVLVPFFDIDAQIDRLVHILDNPAEYEPLKRKARERILEHYSYTDLLPKYWELIQSVANGSQVGPL